ncbi:hypothetical protein OPV22_022836 [Ensete ventricosum]|uniref:Uncharacterized protein n=1 Tax=Ensete ventricosum TaxID=4639 RepID=A0AAV8QVB4_ENSVE|nr:hypothetical protein OPV22_022836 [Ensete ventricosum]
MPSARADLVRSFGHVVMAPCGASIMMICHDDAHTYIAAASVDFIWRAATESRRSGKGGDLASLRGASVAILSGEDLDTRKRLGGSR